MNARKGTLAGITLVMLAGSAATAQPDPDAPWGQWRGSNVQRAQQTVTDGPATNLAWTLDGIAPPSMAGITIGANGNLYFKTRTTAGSNVYRVDAETGSILAVSDTIAEGLGNTGGDYAGVTHGADFLWSAYFASDDGTVSTGILKLDKETLEILDDITNPAFAGLRGEPILSEVQNTAGNYNMYVHDRGNGLIHAIDSATGDLQWSYDPFSTAAFFGRVGAGFVKDGAFHIFYSGNTDLFPSILVRDNGDGTFTELWFGGAESFNWIGTGALGEDAENIYVTTFNDNDADTLWSLDVETGAVNWSVPGNKFEDDELNFFQRPAVLGNRIYAGGGFGVITVFEPNATNDDYTQPWEYREGPGSFGEITAVTVAQGPDGEVYVYAVKQEQGADDENPGAAQYYVFRDDGDDYTLLFTTDLDATMLPTRFGNSSATIAPDGSVYVAGGSISAPTGTEGEVYKFAPEGDDPFPGCSPADLAPPFGVLDIFDVLEFLTLFEAEDPLADLAPPFGVWDIFDVLEFLTIFEEGCP